MQLNRYFSILYQLPSNFITLKFIIFSNIFNIYKQQITIILPN